MSSRCGGTALALAAAGALFLAGCTSLDISSAIGKRVAPAPAPAQQNEQAPAQQNEPAPAPEQKQSRGSGIAYQYQFGAFYSGFWSMGTFGGYKDGSYKPGQGTVWTFTGADRKSSEPMTIERALLKVNEDSSQWWRFKMETGKNTILYEFLVGADSVVKKVRYKDPDTGSIEEFVPSQDRQQPSAVPSNMPKSREEMEKYKVDRQNVKVMAGSFDTDHYLYTDENQNGSAESWVSPKVPGGMVKSVYTSNKDKKTMTGELIQVESGMTTILGSF